MKLFPPGSAPEIQKRLQGGGGDPQQALLDFKRVAAGKPLWPILFTL